MTTAQKIIALVEREEWHETNQPPVRLCFAVRGKTCIDEINSATGRSVCFGETLDEIRKRYPEAEVMSLTEYCRSKAYSQDTPIVWENTDARSYDEMLGCLPPALYTSAGFLVGEPFDHHAITGQPRFQAFIKRGTHFYCSNRPMTRDEFRKETA